MTKRELEEEVEELRSCLERAHQILSEFVGDEEDPEADEAADDAED